MIDFNEIKQKRDSYERQLKEGRELTSEQEEEIKGMRSCLKREGSKEAEDLDDRFVMILDLNLRYKEKRHAL